MNSYRVEVKFVKLEFLRSGICDVYEIFKYIFLHKSRSEANRHFPTMSDGMY